jgi:hypothetical protein
MLLASKIFSKIVTLHNFQINILNIGWNIIENQIGINPLIKKDISVAATTSATAKEKDESHVYEEIDIGLQNGK